MATSLPVELPANLKSIQPYLEMATDYQSMDPSISYWCKLSWKICLRIHVFENDICFSKVDYTLLSKDLSWKE